MVIYDVLYYKRACASKVHRNKGVSKMDGVLTIDPQSGKAVLTNGEQQQHDDESSSEDESIKKSEWKRKVASKRSACVFSGVQRDLIKQDSLHEEQVIVLGNFDVEIVGERGSSSNTTTGSNNNNKSKTRHTLPASSQQQLLPTMKRKFVRSVVPLQSKKIATTTRKTVLPKQPLARPKLAVAKTNTTIRSSRQPSLQPTTKVTAPTLKKGPLQSSKAPTLKKSPLQSRTVNAPTQPGEAAAILPHIPLPNTIRTALRPHQVTGVDFLWRTLSDLRGCILGDEMGLGKTLMTIAVLSGLHRQHRDKQFVVVCPSSLVSNWAKEFDKWLGRASQPKRVVITKGGAEGLQQIKAYCSSMKHLRSNSIGQILIVSYDLFRRNANEFVFPENVSVGLLVADEAHRLKNTNESLTLRALQSLPVDARLCLTATPIQNNLSEFYNLANFCCPNILGDSVASFRKEFDRPIAAANQKNASKAARELGLVKSKELERLSKTFMLRRLQKEVLKTMLPPRTEALLFCQPSPQQKVLYRQIAERAIGNSSTEALTTLTTLRKLCSHPSLCGSSTRGTASLAMSGKLVVLDALLDQIRINAPDDKVVIVSNFTSALTLVEELVLEVRKYKFIRLDGATDVKNRQAQVDAFNRTTPEHAFCFLLSSKAGGCGLNLVGANRLVMLDPDWNPSSDIQAMGRVYRQGQTKPCTIYRLFLTGTVEEVVFQRQAQKGGLSTLTVDAGDRKQKSSTGKFTKEELADCFSLKDCLCDTKSKLGQKWAEYSGAESLQCDDNPLRIVAASIPDTLGFVHIVNDEDTFVSEEIGDQQETLGDEYNSSSESENEF